MPSGDAPAVDASLSSLPSTMQIPLWLEKVQKGFGDRFASCFTDAGLFELSDMVGIDGA